LAAPSGRRRRACIDPVADFEHDELVSATTSIRMTTF
jgi:hypothetical protein